MEGEGRKRRSHPLRLVGKLRLPQRFCPPNRKKPSEFQGDSSNVDLALTRFCTSYTQVFLSDSNHLKRLDILVAGTGFEPVTFRL